MKRNRIRLYSLFSGAGGIDWGFKFFYGFDHLFANELLSDAAKTYSKNFRRKILTTDEISLNVKYPLVLNGKIEDIDFDIFSNNDIDVIIGGPPCQDFSLIRSPENRRGIEVKRGRLYSHFIRALIHIQPKIFIFENVPGLKSANESKAYKEITRDFSSLDIRWDEIRNIVGNSSSNNIKNYILIFSDIVDSSNLGVPQSRRRLIIIGVREDLIEEDWLRKKDIITRVATGILSGNGNLMSKYPLTPLEVLEGLPLPELNDEYKTIMNEYKDVDLLVRSDRSKKWRNEVWEKQGLDIVSDYLQVNRIVSANRKELEKGFEEHEKILRKLGFYGERLEGKHFPDLSNNIHPDSEGVLERMKMIPPDENHLFVKGTKWEVEGKGISLIYRRIHPLKPSYAIVAYGGGGTWGYHYKRNRGRLTNRERARLQTFPDSFQFIGTSTQVRAQIGEAVPPLLGKNISEAIIRIFENL